ncbi:MAG TPA: LacI family DNA-binding transcriptional regulator [Candidatus Limiplasma sp.]|nr:LacI family DNA-binding transcriptional regulator [Candidatus Limiplasma sp.]HRX08618.1 LacI family DNA-binding transcriptional regulator [Candidatus Limiplasma sp.]
MATLKEVADLAGVTVTTVSRMLNKPDMVNPATIKRIRQAMSDLDYRPNELARSLSKKTSNFIGLIVPSARNAFFAKVIERMERHITCSGYKLLLCVSNHERKKELEYFSMLKAHKVAGVIIASHTQDLAESISFDAPILSIDRVISPQISAVCSDNLNGGRMAAELLIRKGCKHIAYFSGGAMLHGMNASLRQQGFEQAVREHGMEPIVQLNREDRFISMKYEDLITAFFDTHPTIDGAVCSNDILAAEIIRFAKRRGISVPEKLKVVGYDDIDLAALYSPSITSVHQPVNDICRFAVESIIQFGKRPLPSSTIFPVRLVERESTGG